MQAIILAGGKGARLKPFTNAIPKPLVPIGDVPILEVILRQLKNAGITEITIAVNHLARLIEAFFGDGSEMGLSINYSLEEKILGTAGPLRLVKHLQERFLVMNGDILTTLDYNALHKFHVDGNNSISIATFQKKIKVDLGVLEAENQVLKNYIEKPEYAFLVSMGVYFIERKVIDLIPYDEFYDLPDLVLAAMNKGLRVGCYQGDYDWLDIGRLDDYERAVSLFESNRHKYLPG